MTEDNYFELYGLPVSFFPDQDLLRTAYYRLSREFHPDLQDNSDPEAANMAMQKTALNNEAYRILTNKDKRIKYVLELKGALLADEKYQLPPSFLAEMMDLNEAVMELQFDPDEEAKTRAVEDAKAVMEGLELDTDKLCKEYDATGNEELLAKIKDLYYRKKYILRLIESLEKGA